MGGTIEVPEIGKAGLPGAFGISNANAENLILNGGTISIRNQETSSDRSITLGSNGGTFDLSYTNANLTISGTLTGTGSLTKTGNGTLTLNSGNNYTNGTLINGDTIFLGSDIANISGLGTNPVTLKNGTLSMLDNSSSYNDNCSWGIIVPAGYSGNLNLDSRCSLTGTLEGEGTLNIFSPFTRSDLLGDWSHFSGKINVTTDSDGGTFMPGNNKGYGKSTIYLGNKVTAFYSQTGSDTIEIGALAGDAGSILGAGGEGNTTITWKIGTNNSNSNFNGIINDTQYKNTGAKTSIIKSGTGTFSLTGANTYSGNTRVEGGILLANNRSGSATSSGNVMVAPGGTLGGTGLIGGNVTIDQGAVIAPGTDGLGYLTVNNNVTLNSGSYLAIDVNTIDKLSDMLIVSGKLQLGGILYLSEMSSGSFEAGNNYKIIDATSCSGQFEEIIPSTPGIGLKWDTTGITVTGYISVVQFTGININSTNDQVKIYPNPASNKITVTMEGSDLFAFGKEIRIQCIDNQGRYIEQLPVKFNGNQLRAEIDIRNLKSGIYVLVISGKNYQSTGHFVKE